MQIAIIWLINIVSVLLSFICSYYIQLSYFFRPSSQLQEMVLHIVISFLSYIFRIRGMANHHSQHQRHKKVHTRRGSISGSMNVQNHDHHQGLHPGSHHGNHDMMTLAIGYHDMTTSPNGCHDMMTSLTDRWMMSEGRRPS